MGCIVPPWSLVLPKAGAFFLPPAGLFTGKPCFHQRHQPVDYGAILYFRMTCKMLFDQLVKLAHALPETNAAPLQGIEDACQVAVIAAGTISVGKRILPVECFCFVSEFPELLSSHLGAHRRGGKAEQGQRD